MVQPDEEPAIAKNHSLMVRRSGSFCYVVNQRKKERKKRINQWQQSDQSALLDCQINR